MVVGVCVRAIKGKKDHQASGKMVGQLRLTVPQCPYVGPSIITLFISFLDLDSKPSVYHIYKPRKTLQTMHMFSLYYCIMPYVIITWIACKMVQQKGILMTNAP
ncbi:hypothetical protein ANANG_G00319490 [Anguilla anguilla]|uniref:Uncharacterized protein n=1 Tax=Anguilla anguilla TaxID=7936 RepID=A0A9D3LNW6_ANGAN|nr:hypothetical protein ANANG_G00319490 [Anguilla anguilla]